MQLVHIQANYVPDDKVFRVKLTSFALDYTPAQYRAMVEEAERNVGKKSKDGYYLSKPDGKSKSIEFCGDGAHKTFKQIVIYLRKVLGSWELMYGVSDGQHRHPPRWNDPPHHN